MNAGSANRCLRVAAGLVLIAGGTVGAWRAGVVAAAQIDYLHLKYGGTPVSLEHQREVAEKAYRRYPSNFNLAILMAERYWHARDGAGDRAATLAESERWCDRGLAENAFNSALLLVKANLIAERDIGAAIDHWAAYVEWDYWNSYNHAFLADLYCRAGRFEEAADRVRLLRGRREHAWISQRLSDAILADMQPPADTP